jgi:hypothetical protein
LWTEADAPLEYIELQLCRDVYHCLPWQLGQEKLPKVLQHMTCLQIEAEVNEIKRKK